MTKYNIDQIITESLVHKLIKSQFPEWANLSLHFIEHGGNDNRTFRLGDAMVVRLPSAQIYEAQVEKESIWLPILAAQLSTPITLPIAKGKADFGYPYSWSVNKWLEGEALQTNEPNKSQLAIDLAKFLKELHLIDCSNGPKAGTHNFHRGAKLSVYTNEVEEALQKLEGTINTDTCNCIWQIGLSSNWKNSPVWVHGDVAIGNLLVDKSSLVGVIDFGILGVGDPACDLVMAWTYFDDCSRNIFMSEMNMDSDTWDRARAWALWKALINVSSI